MMLVCEDRGGEVVPVGRTSLRQPAPSVRQIDVAERESACPYPYNGLVNVFMRRYDIRDVPLSHGRERVILLGPDDDPSHLPDWKPFPRRPGVYARHKESGVDYVLRQVPEEFFRRAVERDTFTRLTPPVTGRPLIWAFFGARVEVWPEPRDEYEIINLVLPTPSRHFGELGRPREMIELTPSPELGGVVSQMERLREAYRRPFATFGEIHADERVPPNHFFAVDPARPGADEAVVTVGHIQNGNLTIDISRPLPEMRTTAAAMARMQEEIQRRMHEAMAVPPNYIYAEHLWRRMFVARSEPANGDAARQRARGLLKSLLRPEQWAEFEAHGQVVERINGAKFTLRPGMRIEAEKQRLGNRVREFWCVSPSMAHDWIPPEDQLIGQLLHLRDDPDTVRRTANIFPTQGYV